MSNVTKLTYAKYVALVEAGGKALGFRSYDFGGKGLDARFAHRSLVVMGHFDETPVPEDERDVYYTLTE